MSMPASWREFLGFGFSARLVFKGGWPDSENSKLVKAPTFPKVTSRNPGHTAGAPWHRYFTTSRNVFLGPRRLKASATIVWFLVLEVTESWQMQ